MNRVIRFSAVLLVAAIPSMPVSPAYSQQNCETYGKLALRQAIEADKSNCGFTGPRWSKDYHAHIAWCSTVGPTEWRSELKKRKHDLKKCKG